MAVVVEPQRLLGLFLFGIIKLSIISKELRGYLIALLFAINYHKCYYNHWNTYRRIDGIFRTAPDQKVGFFILQKNVNFFIKSVDKLSCMVYNIHVR